VVGHEQLIPRPVSLHLILDWRALRDNLEEKRDRDLAPRLWSFYGWRHFVVIFL
jgi:hypothetical protein